MLICPVCRSQNMDTARFCGNCGNPFPRPSMPTSSLINCPQGHVYSAVYQFCPYCPQPEAVTPIGSQADFATRIEEPVTAIEPPISRPLVPPQADFSTRAAEPFATNFETRVGSPEIFETRLNDGAIEEVSIPPAGTSIGAASVTTISEMPVATEVMSFFAQTTIAEIPVDQYPQASNASSATLEIPVAPVASPPPPQAPPINVPSVAAPPPPMAQTVVSDPIPVAAPHVGKAQASSEMDRRTLIVTEGQSAQSSSKGKIVGWLITYNRNPDGDDFRLYAGYNRIGANPVCDIVLDDETVSGSHAIIVFREGRFLIKDDLSRNGTFVNNREINEAHPLQNYDQVRIGNTYLTFIAAQRIA